MLTLSQLVITVVALTIASSGVVAAQSTPTPVAGTDAPGVAGAVVREFEARDVERPGIAFASFAVMAFDERALRDGTVDPSALGAAMGSEVRSWAMDSLPQASLGLPKPRDVEVSQIGQWTLASFGASPGDGPDAGGIVFGEGFRMFSVDVVGFGEGDGLLWDLEALAKAWLQSHKGGPGVGPLTTSGAQGLWRWLPAASLVEDFIVSPHVRRQWILVDGSAIGSAAVQQSRDSVMAATETPAPTEAIVPKSVGANREAALAAWGIPANAEPVLDFTVDSRQDITLDTRDMRYQISFVFQLEEDDRTRTTDRVLYVGVSLIEFLTIPEAERMAVMLLPKDAEPLGEWAENRFGEPVQAYHSDAIESLFPNLQGEGVGRPGTIWVTLGMVGSKVGVIEVSVFDANE